MKKTYCLLLFLSLISITSLHAQPGDNNRDRKGGEGKERIKALYVAYITQELNLNETEAQKFWPVQEQYSSEIKSINKDKNSTELAREEITLNIKKKYNDKFSKIIGNDRTDQFFKKDKEFRGKLLENLKEKRKGGGKQKDKMDN
jgi:hypothetical protein